MMRKYPSSKKEKNSVKNKKIRVLEEEREKNTYMEIDRIIGSIIDDFLRIAFREAEKRIVLNENIKELIREEIHKSREEIKETIEKLEKGKIDYREETVSIESLTYVHYKKTKNMLMDLGFSKLYSKIIATLATSSELKGYCLPSHQLRVKEFVEFIDSQNRLEINPEILLIHDIGKAAFHSSTLKGTKESIIENLKLEDIKYGVELFLTKAHVYFDSKFVEQIAKITGDYEIYIKQKKEIKKAFDHHLYTYGYNKGFTKAILLFADQLDALMSYRTYFKNNGIESIKERTKIILDCASDYNQIIKKEIKTKIIKDMLKQYIDYKYKERLTALFGKNYLKEPKINEEELEDLRIKFNKVMNDGNYIENITKEYLELNETERIVAAYAIGATAYELKERIKK